MTRELAGKVALVTGGGSGIGEATATRFASAGAKVVVADINASHATKVAEGIVKNGGEALAVQVDVCVSAQVQAMVRSGVNQFGRIDIAANVAGVELESALAGDHRAAGIEEAIFDKIIAVNLKGLWLCVKYEIQQMLLTGGGAIVNCASAGGLGSVPGMTAYCASKHGVVGLGKTAGVDYARDNIRVNTVCPGGVNTPMVKDYYDNPQYRELMKQGHPIGRIAEPGEIAEAILFLSSDKARFIVGAAFSVDGGWSA